MDEKTLTQLLNPKAFNHPTSTFKVIETHISWVILTGDYAYKIKKPVQFDFVDFTHLEKRRFFCEEELRLNQILCPDLYIEVCTIVQNESSEANKSSDMTIISTSDQNHHIIDYALKMKQFNQDALLSSILAYNENVEKKDFMMDDIAKQLAYFHKNTSIALSDAPFGNLLSISEPMVNNFSTIESFIGTDQNLSDIKSYCLAEFEKLSSLFLERKAKNHIRDCHGDLHLGNLFFDRNISEHVCIFDRIEFNLNFRFIDVMNEIAFLVMDLKSHAKNSDAFCFLNAYVELTGDYEGLPILSFYEIYRALIRIKVALLSAKANESFNRNLNTALQIMHFQKTNKPILIMMHGISGSGKTYLAKQLAPHLSAIVIRSDVERKRLFFEITKKDPTVSLEIELYNDEMTKMTFDKLLHLAEIIINSGYSVIVDATFLRISQRKPFIELSKKLNCPFKILHCETPIELIHQRVTERFHLKKDASDADSRVVELQLTEYEELTKDEQKHRVSIDTTLNNISSIGDIFR